MNFSVKFIQFHWYYTGIAKMILSHLYRVPLFTYCDWLYSRASPNWIEINLHEIVHSYDIKIWWYLKTMYKFTLCRIKLTCFNKWSAKIINKIKVLFVKKKQKKLMNILFFKDYIKHRPFWKKIKEEPLGNMLKSMYNDF